MVLVANLCEGFGFADIFNNRLKLDNGSKFFSRCSHHSAKPLFERALADQQFFDQFLDLNGSLGLVNNFNCLDNKFIRIDFPQLCE